VNHSPELDKIAPALCGLQAELEPVIKANVAEGKKFSYSWAKLEDCWRAAQPLLTKHGLSVCQTGMPSERPDEILLTTTLIHESGQYISGTISMSAGLNAGPQDYGGAISYARRYMFCSICGIITEDDDAQSAQKKHNQRRAEAKPATGDNDLDDLIG
jgi:hypothetical protein